MAEEKKDSKFNWKDLNYGQLAQGISSGLKSGMQQSQTRNRVLNIRQQIQMNREQFENTMNQRNEEMNQSLAMIRSTESRRGVSGTTTGIVQGMSDRAESQERVIENEMLLTERNLMFASAMEEAIGKQQKRNSLINIATSSIATGFSAGLGS